MLAVGAGAFCVVAACAGRDPEAGLRRPDLQAPATTAAAPATLPPAAVPACPPIPARVSPPASRPSYVLRIDVRPTEALVEGDQEVEFRPDADTDRIVLRLWPNGPRQLAEGARLDVHEAHVDGRPVAPATEDPTSLVLRTGGPFRAGRAVRVALRWTLHLPPAVRDRISAEPQSVRLGSFFPILEWQPGVGWPGDPPTTQFAEASTAPTADFDLTVTAPAGLTVVASGVQDGPGHWKAVAMRDIAVVVGSFTVVSAQARAPDPVTVTFAVQNGIAEQPSAWLPKIVAVLEDFGRRFGPYPWPTLTVSVTTTLRSGIEYPTHIMHGPGTSGRTLTHEIGHQWFYGLVGNNQARDPWLDEGAATWAEARWEGTVESYAARSIPPVSRGRLGEPMTFWDRDPSVYFPGVYVQGTQALAELGDAELVDCALRVYVAQNAYRIATPADFVAAMGAVFPDARTRLAARGVRP
ncbi:MAG: hypothetical protein M3179_13870 [Actinomycetota bacterium]|nr:hypothetical protein [Actinomycetota bacterium]